MYFSYIGTRYHHDIEKNTLNEMNFHRYKNIPCQKFTSNEISCEVIDKQESESIKTKIFFDRLNGTVEIKRESIRDENNSQLDEFEGSCKPLSPKF